jgi:hypothetical protein
MPGCRLDEVHRRFDLVGGRVLQDLDVLVFFRGHGAGWPVDARGLLLARGRGDSAARLLRPYGTRPSGEAGGEQEKKMLKAMRLNSLHETDPPRDD